MRGFVNVSRTKGYSDVENFQFEIPQYGGAGTELIAKSTGYASGAQVKVVLDEQMADLYTLEGKFIMSCPRVIGASQSHAETSDEKGAALGNLLGRKTAQTNYTDEFAASLEEAFGETFEDVSYEHAMALGGNKESYNGNQLNNENNNLKNKTKQRINRDFNNSDWSA